MIEYVDRIRNDLKLNMIVIISAVLIMLLLILKVETSEPAVKIKNLAIITIEWPGTSDYDIDMWIKTPDGRHVGYSNKEGGGAVLQRDDTGLMQDAIKDDAGQTIGYVTLNQEIINLRYLQPGRYYVNIIVFSAKDTYAYTGLAKETVTKGQVEIKSRLIQVTPFIEYIGEKNVMSTECSQTTTLVFEIDDKLEIEFIDEDININMGIPCSQTASDEMQ